MFRPQFYQVTMQRDEDAFCVKVGIARQKAYEAHAARKGLKPDVRPGISGENAHIMGARCERALSLALGRPWDAKVFTEVDFSNTANIFDVDKWEVRGTSYPQGRLAIKSKDKDDAPYVLVIRNGLHYKVGGWLMAWEGKREQYRRKYYENLAWSASYFVPQDQLSPIWTLPDHPKSVTLGHDPSAHRPGGDAGPRPAPEGRELGADRGRAPAPDGRS